MAINASASSGSAIPSVVREALYGRQCEFRRPHECEQLEHVIPIDVVSPEAARGGRPVAQHGRLRACPAGGLVGAQRVARSVGIAPCRKAARCDECGEIDRADVMGRDG